MRFHGSFSTLTSIDRTIKCWRQAAPPENRLRGRATNPVVAMRKFNEVNRPSACHGGRP